jgi:hypothetical protein
MATDANPTADAIVDEAAMFDAACAQSRDRAAVIRQPLGFDFGRMATKRTVQ